MRANTDQLIAIVRTSPDDRFQIVAPVYHAAAAINVFNTVDTGGTLVIMEDFDPQAVFRALDEDRITATILVPAMIQACLVAAADVEDRS